MQTVVVIVASFLALGQANQGPLGMPITVDLQEGRCRFLIEDMWISNTADMERVLNRFSDKRHQIDVVWSDEEDRQCVSRARLAAERSGFTNIVVRKGTSGEYPDMHG